MVLKKMKKINTSPHTLVIGAGAGGLTVSVGLSGLGKEVVLIEKGEMGGDCTNVGCVPSKAMIHAAKTMKMSNAMEYVHKIRDEIRSHETPEVLKKKYGITTVKGTAIFVENKKIEVVMEDRKKKVFTPKHIVIATGSKPKHMDIPRLPKEKYFTNETIFEIEKLPKKLVIVGAGVIACELAQAFNKLGTEVHIVYYKRGLLNSEGDLVSAQMTDIFAKEGIHLHWHVTNSEYVKGNLVLKQKKGSTTIKSVTAVMVAVGREPNIDTLGLENTDIVFSSKGIEVDSKYKTTVKKVYAVGDAAQGANFTHVANQQGRQVIKSIAFPTYTSWQKTGTTCCNFY